MCLQTRTKDSTQELSVNVDKSSFITTNIKESALYFVQD